MEQTRHLLTWWVIDHLEITKDHFQIRQRVVFVPLVHRIWWNNRTRKTLWKQEDGVNTCGLLGGVGCYWTVLNMVICYPRIASKTFRRPTPGWDRGTVCRKSRQQIHSPPPSTFLIPHIGFGNSHDQSTGSKTVSANWRYAEHAISAHVGDNDQFNICFNANLLVSTSRSRSVQFEGYRMGGVEPATIAFKCHQASSST